MLEFVDGTWSYADSSTNGTFVDGQRVRTFAFSGPIEVRFGAADGEAVGITLAAPSDGAAPGPSVPFRGTRSVSVGRDATNDIVVPDPRVLAGTLRSSPDRTEPGRFVTSKAPTGPTSTADA